MQDERCRLCLCCDNLGPIFENMDHIESCSSDLVLATGIQIKPNDGLPQKICFTCKDHVNIALDLRKRANITALKLLHSDYSVESESKEGSEIEDKTLDLDPDVDLATNCHASDGFTVEIEIDRLTQDQQDGGGDISQNGGGDISQNGGEKNKSKGLSVKEKRKIYMSLVEGDFDSNGPVKCKVCMATVSKWACFVNHAKKHLGFKFICEFCGKSFISTHQLKRHCRSYHGLERELKCEQCSYLALDKAQLVLHSRRAHTGVRPFVCDTCSASYHSRKCLLQHLESHIPDATVQCDACPLRLKSRRHLAKHRYSAHGGKRKRARQRAKQHTGMEQ